MRRFLSVSTNLGLLAYAWGELQGQHHAPAYGRQKPPLVHVCNGTYAGLSAPQYGQDYFLGIPYAQPPLGDLRLRVPQSLNESWTSVRPATEFSPECYGYGSDQWPYPVSEDCLTLNVVRPAGLKPHDRLPVALWIHGGGFFEGGSRDQRYNSSFIVQNSVHIGQPIIAVSINYRLSGWGFLVSKEVEESGNLNLGMRDQRLAMQWVRENIGAFGGDPDKVTIWGESAGALSVGLHLVAYGGRDDHLFRAAIMESGNPTPASPLNSTAFFQPLYDNVTAAVGCADAADSLQCLRTVPVDVLSDAFNTSSATTWNPHIDGDFLQTYPSEQLSKGQFIHVPIIDGTNSDEGTAFGAMGVNTTEQFRNMLTGTNQSPLAGVPLDPSLADQILAAYPDIPEEGIPGPALLGDTRPAGDLAAYGVQWRRVSAFAGDYTFIAARRLTCQTWAGAGVPAYSYRFNTLPNGIPPIEGVTHFQEVVFVYDNLNSLGYYVSPPPLENVPRSYLELAKLMSYTWVSFIAIGDPNAFRHDGSKFAKFAKVPKWPSYNITSPQNIVWDGNVTSFLEADTYRAAGIDLINSQQTNAFLR